MQTNDQIIIGKAPDYVMRVAAVEYYHHISIALTKGDVVIQSQSVSNKSLTQLVNEIKKMIAPWGWRKTDHFTWLKLPELIGTIQTETGKITLQYYYLELLTLDQKIRFMNIITEKFNPNQQNPNSKKD